MRYTSKIGIMFFIVAMGLTSCEPVSDCKSCEVVTYDVNDGHEIYRESAVEYCGPDLDEKENTAPVISGDERIVWECK